MGHQPAPCSTSVVRSASTYMYFAPITPGLSGDARRQIKSCQAHLSCPVQSSPIQCPPSERPLALPGHRVESSRIESRRVESESSRVESSQSRVESSQRCLHLRFQTVMSSHVKKSEGTSCCSASVNLVRSKTWKALLAETPQSGAVPGRAVTLSSLSPT